MAFAWDGAHDSGFFPRLGFRYRLFSGWPALGRPCLYGRCRPLWLADAFRAIRPGSRAWIVSRLGGRLYPASVDAGDRPFAGVHLVLGPERMAARFRVNGVSLAAVRTCLGRQRLQLTGPP